MSELMTPVLAIVLRFLCSALTDLALVLKRDQIAGVFLYLVVVGAPVCAATISTVACGESRDGQAHD